MQLGFVGLGKMGLNMVTRLARGGHAVVAFDRSADAVARADGAGAQRRRRRSRRWSTRSPPPRAVWVMVPAGDPTESTVDRARRAAVGRRRHHRRRQHELSRRRAARADARRPSGIHYVDAGTSGGIWGLHGRLLPDGRRRSRRLRAARADLPDARAAQTATCASAITAPATT